VPHLLKELEDDPCHVSSEYDAHLCELLVAVPVISAQPVEVLPGQTLHKVGTD